MPKYAEGARHVSRNGTVFVVNGGKWAAASAPKVDTQEDSHLQKEADEAHNKRVLADAAHDFMRLNEQTSTGPGRAIGLPLPHWLGGGVNVSEGLQTTPGSPLYDPNIKAMEGVANRYIPQLRPVGSGPIRNTELELFKKAFPNIRNGGEDNSRLTQQYETEAQRAEAQVRFKRNYLHSNGNLSGWEDAFKATDAHPAPMAGMAMAPTAPTTAAPAAAPKAPHELSDAELMAAAGLK